MDLEIGNSYILVVEGSGQNLTYTCKIIAIDNTFITFIDKLGKTLNYRKDKIISFEKIDEIHTTKIPDFSEKRRIK